MFVAWSPMRSIFLAPKSRCVHRLMLHALRLEVVHPDTREPLLIEAPLDAAWLRLMAAFGWQDAVPSTLAR